MIVKASSKRSTRWSNGKPNARNSVSFQPAPRPEDEAAAAQLVDRRRLLGEHRRLVEARARDQGPELDPRGRRRERGEQRPGLPRPARRPVLPPVQEVVADPHRVEPDALHGTGHRESSGHRTSRSTSGSWMPTFSGRRDEAGMAVMVAGVAGRLGAGVAGCPGGHAGLARGPVGARVLRRGPGRHAGTVGGPAAHASTRALRAGRALGRRGQAGGPREHAGRAGTRAPRAGRRPTRARGRRGPGGTRAPRAGGRPRADAGVAGRAGTRAARAGGWPRGFARVLCAGRAGTRRCPGRVGDRLAGGLCLPAGGVPGNAGLAPRGSGAAGGEETRGDPPASR